MELDKTIRENLDGDYLTIHVENFKEGVEYAAQKMLLLTLRNLTNCLKRCKIYLSFKILET